MIKSEYCRLNSVFFRCSPHCAIGALVLLWCVRLHASDLSDKLPYGLQIHGFASQGFIYTSDNNFFGSSEKGGSFDYRELGVNASIRPLPTLQLSAQIVSRTAGEGSKGDIRLDYGFVDYSFVSNETNLLGLRLGRTKNPLGIYNDTRDVPFARPSILLPQSIYFDRTRNLAFSADSIEGYGENRSDIGDLSFQFGVINPIVDDPDTEAGILGGERPGTLAAKTSYIGRVIYERDAGRLRFGLSGAQVNVGYDPAAPFPSDFRAGSIRFSPMILSAQYNAERWSFTSEYALRHFRLKDFGVPALNLDFSGESYYLQGTYRFNPKWEAVLRYDALYTNKDDRAGSVFNMATGRPAHSRYAKDWTVGLRWNITPSVMLSGEYHRVNGTAWLPLLDNPNPATATQKWDLFALLLSYRF